MDKETIIIGVAIIVSIAFVIGAFLFVYSLVPQSMKWLYWLLLLFYVCSKASK